MANSPRRDPRRQVRRGASTSRRILADRVTVDDSFPEERNWEAVEHRDTVFLWAVLYDEAIRLVSEWRNSTRRRISLFNPHEYDFDNATFWRRKFEQYRYIEVNPTSTRSLTIEVKHGTYPNEKRVGVQYDLGDEAIYVSSNFPRDIDTSSLPKKLKCEPGDAERKVHAHLTAVLRLFHPIVERIPSPGEKAERLTRREPTNSGPVEILRNRSHRPV